MNLIRFQNHPTRVFNDLFDSFFERGMMGRDMEAFNMSPAVNVVENKENYELEMAAPGMKKEDFKIKLENNVLSISSEQKDEQVQEKKDYTRREFHYSTFSRSFHLPKTVNLEKINAEYNNGILKIVLPKKEEVVVNQDREITVG